MESLRISLFRWSRMEKYSALARRSSWGMGCCPEEGCALIRARKAKLALSDRFSALHRGTCNGGGHYSLTVVSLTAMGDLLKYG